MQGEQADADRDLWRVARLLAHGARVVLRSIDCKSWLYVLGQGWRLVGDKCEGKTATCAVGGKALLECKGDKLENTTECRGQLGCRVQGTSVSCDRSFGLAGDACEGDSAACSVDGTEMLLCKKGKLALSRKCKCLAIGTSIRCN